MLNDPQSKVCGMFITLMMNFLVMISDMQTPRQVWHVHESMSWIECGDEISLRSFDDGFANFFHATYLMKYICSVHKGNCPCFKMKSYRWCVETV